MTYHCFTRQEFYDLVWSQPLSQLAKRVGISDVALGKLCRNEQIPHPAVGYWAKLGAGKKVGKIDLPPRGLGKSDLIEFGRDPYDWHLQTAEELLAQPAPRPPEFSETMHTVRERALKLAEKAPIKKSLSNPHSIIAGLLAADIKRKEELAKSPYGFVLAKPSFDTSIDKRRLQILNALFLALTYCNCTPSIRGKDAREIHVRVGDVLLPVKLGTPSEVLDEASRHSSKKNDVQDLRFIIVGWLNASDEISLQWSDTEASKLEDQLKEIVVGMLVAGEWMYRASRIDIYNRKIEERRKAEAEIQRKNDEAHQLDKELAAKLKHDKRRQLVVEMLSWKRAIDLREFITASLMKAHEIGDATLIEKTEEWAVWANAEVDEIDSLPKL